MAMYQLYACRAQGGHHVLRQRQRKPAEHQAESAEPQAEEPVSPEPDVPDSGGQVPHVPISPE